MTALWLGAMSALKHVFMRVVSKKFFIWAFFWAGKMIVDSTETPHDNEWYDEVKRLYEQSEREEA